MKSQFPTIISQIEALIEGETDVIANMANISAVLFNALSEVNWAGFYRVVDKQLVLGPFQGQPACIRIPIGKGVCGTAVSEQRIQLIDDVHQFDGHIRCDTASQSEIVLPIWHGKEIVAVLDIDSPVLARFTQNDAEHFQLIVKLLEKTMQ